MFEGRPLVKGTWRRLKEESNSMLSCEEGTWENWVLGSPGGVRNIRLYDPAGANAAVLKDYLAGTTAGEGIIIVPEFAGPFDVGDFHWIQIQNSWMQVRNIDASEREDSPRTTRLSTSPNSVAP